MPCAAPSRNNLGAMAPCNIPDVYAGGICKWHWQMKNGLIQPVAGLDPQTVLLLHGESLTDAAGHPLTANGGVATSSAQSKFGGSSLLFDGVDDWLWTPDSPDWNLGAGDFTVECWAYFNLVSGLETMVAQWPTAGGPTSWLMRYDNAGPRLSFYYSPDGAVATPIHNAWTPVPGQWYHVAVVRTGNNLMAFINGVQIGTTQTLSGAIFDSTAALTVGACAPFALTTPTWLMNGYLDEIRVSKGVARWTAPFSPPTAPY